jgi:Skp family chaperone for outer membrane proteins
VLKVTNSLRLCTGAVLLTLLAAGLSNAQQVPQQQPPQQSRPAGPPQQGATGAPTHPGAGAMPAAHGHAASAGGVAIIDLPYILKNHGGFNQRVEELRHEAEGVENDFKAKRDAVQKLMVQLDDLQRGSTDFKKLEEDITKRQANLSVEINIMKKKFQEAEAKIYYEAYQQILNEVKYYAEANRINLVLKFNGDEANKDNPEEIMREMQKMVLYYNHAIDITPIILEKMKGTAQRPTGTNPSAQRPAPGVPQRRPN